MPYTRATTILHRSGITSNDMLATATQPTGSDVATGGSLVFNTAYNFSVAAGNKYGFGIPATKNTVTTANDSNSTHVMRITVAQVPNAEYYDIFCSTDSNPKWAGRITESQRAGAGTRITAVGTVDTAGANSAGTVDVQVAGTGTAIGTTPWGGSTGNFCAWTPQLITPFSMQGYNYLGVYVRATIAANADLHSWVQILPAVYPWVQNSITGDYHAYATSSFGPQMQLSNLSQTLSQYGVINVAAANGPPFSGASNVVLTVGQITTAWITGVSVDVYVDRW